MNPSLMKLQWTVAGAAWLLAGARLTGTATRAASEETGVEVKLVRMEKLFNVLGKMLTAVVVADAPAGRSGAHHPAGSVFADVLLGAIRSENAATGPVKIYQAGESCFEPPRGTSTLGMAATVSSMARGISPGTRGRQQFLSVICRQ